MKQKQQHKRTGNTLITYRVTVKHDDGSIRLKVKSDTKDRAIKQVMDFENCPRRSIIKVEELSREVIFWD